MAQDVETSSPDPGVNTRGYGRGSGETGLVWATWGFARHLPSVLCACIGQYYRYSSLILFQDECDEIPILIFFFLFFFCPRLVLHQNATRAGRSGSMAVPQMRRCPEMGWRR